MQEPSKGIHDLSGSRWRTLLAVAVGLALAVLVLIGPPHCSAGDEHLPPTTPVVETSAEPRRIARPAEPEERSPQPTSDATVTAFVCDKDEQPIMGSAIELLPDDSSRYTRKEPSHVIGITDHTGRTALDSHVDCAGGLVAVSHPKYRPLLVPFEAWEGEKKFVLREGHEQTVLFRTVSGRGLSNVRAMLSRADFCIQDEAPVCNLRSNAPVYSEISDDDGYVTFSSLSSGSYYLRQSHSEMFPVDMKSIRKIDVPNDVVLIDFSQLVAVAVIPESEVGVLEAWRRRSIQSSGHRPWGSERGLRTIRSRLQAQWEHAVVDVLPSCFIGERSCVIEVLLCDGRVLQREFAYSPLPEVREPEIWVVDDGPSRAGRLCLKFSYADDEKEIVGLEEYILIGKDRASPLVHGLEGDVVARTKQDSIALPPGAYVVASRSAVSKGLFDPRLITIKSGLTTDVNVRIEDRLGCVRIQAISDDLEEGIEARIEMKQESHDKRARLRVLRGGSDAWLPVGEWSYSATARGHRPSTGRMVITGGRTSLSMRLRLAQAP